MSYGQIIQKSPNVLYLYLNHVDHQSVRHVQDSLLFPTPSFRGLLAVRVPGQAREFYEASLAALTPKDTSDGGSQTYAYVVGSSGDAVLNSMFLIATAVVPTIYSSNDHVDQASDVDQNSSPPKPVCPESVVVHPKQRWKPPSRKICSARPQHVQ